MIHIVIQKLKNLILLEMRKLGTLFETNYNMKSHLPFKAILLALITAFSSTAFAGVEQFDSQESCFDVRLDKNGGPFSKIPTYNQALGVKSDPNICYAISASELIDAYRIRQSDQVENLTSPLSIALNFRLSDSIKSDPTRAMTYDDSDPLTFMVSGGFIFQAINSADKIEVCDQKWLEQFVNLMSTSPAAKPFDEFILNLAQIPNSLPLRPELIQNTLSNLSHFCMDHRILLSLPKVQKLDSPGGNYLDEQAKLIRQLQNPNLTDGERKAMTLSFKEKFDPILKIQLFGQKINWLLNQPKSTGIGIGFLYRAIGSNEHFNSIGAHASVIIGRRFNKSNQTCEFLVRDSYGANCSDKNGNPRYVLPCENGAVWVEGRSLLQDTMDLTWLPAP